MALATGSCIAVAAGVSRAYALIAWGEDGLELHHMCAMVAGPTLGRQSFAQLLPL